MRVGMVAGEASGDNLGASLLDALRTRVPTLEAFGICGPRMRAAGCEQWAAADELAVMGLAEVAGHLPRLLRLRRRIAQRFIQAKPDVFIGIDAPDFNLGLEKRLRTKGLRTVQYVSPSVWAWRRGRMKKIVAATDCVLCLLPFEKSFYDSTGHRAEFVGHPLADEIALDNPAEPARKILSIPTGAPVLALLPGSRGSEVARLGPVFASTVAILARQHPQLEFVAPMASSAIRSQFEAQLKQRAPGVHVHLLDGQAQLAMTAANSVLLASGTAVLEALLLGRPHVVTYRVSPVTASMVRMLGLLHTDHFALTNLLAGRELVPELIQEQATPHALAAALSKQICDDSTAAALAQAFRHIHLTLRRGASERAAEAIISLAGPQ